MKRAFTLIEILVSLAIVGALLALGIYAMTYLQRVMLADQASSDFISLITETKNLAKNNSVNQITDKTLLTSYQFGYKLSFKDNTIKRSLCWKEFNDDWSTIIACNNEVDLKAQSYSAIILTPKDTTSCDEVIFENLTEKIVFLQDGTMQSAKTCSISVKYADNNTLFKTLKFNSENGSYSVE